MTDLELYYAWIFTALATLAVLLVTGILDVFLGLF